MYQPEHEDELSNDDNEDIPLCPICQDILVVPTRLPCRCNRPHCFEELREYFDSHGSACPTCKTKISAGRIRRVGGWDIEKLEWIDRELWNKIQTKFAADLRRKEEGDYTEAPVAVVHQVCEPGEIGEFLYLWQQKHDNEKAEEELNNEKLLLEFLERECPQEAKRIKTMQEDRDLAAKLQIKYQHHAIHGRGTDCELVIQP